MSKINESSLAERLKRCKIGDRIMMFFDNGKVTIVEDDVIICITDTVDNAIEFLEDQFGIE